MTSPRLDPCRMFAPVDAAGPSAMPVLFELVMCGAMVRLLTQGGVDMLFLRPSFFFKYLGFGWVRPLPAPWIHLLVAALAALALCVAAGVRSRAAAALFGLGFAYLELNDVTTY